MYKTKEQLAKKYSKSQGNHFGLERAYMSGWDARQKEIDTLHKLLELTYNNQAFHSIEKSASEIIYLFKFKK